MVVDSSGFLAPAHSAQRRKPNGKLNVCLYIFPEGGGGGEGGERQTAPARPPPPPSAHSFPYITQRNQPELKGNTAEG